MMDINVKKNRTLFILEMNNDKRNNMMCIKSTQTNPPNTSPNDKYVCRNSLLSFGVVSLKIT